MRISISILAAALVGAVTGTASAQGVPGDRTGGASAEVPGTTGGRGSNPAGVIDGTNTNPNPRRAGGIRSPERTGTVGGADTGAAVETGAPARAPVR